MADDDNDDSLPAAIAQSLRIADLVPTQTAAELLRLAARLGNLKTADQDILSSSGLLYAAVQSARPLRDSRDAEAEAMRLVLFAFVGEKGEREDAFKSVIMSDFYAREPQNLGDYPARAGTRFSDQMQNGINELQGQGNLSVIDLIAAALTDPSEFLARRLKALKVDAESLKAQILSLKERRIEVGRAEGAERAETFKPNGFNASYRREHSGELALSASQYALVLARLFRVAKGEFSLALLAPWGSGKTTIAREIERYLTRGDAYAAALQQTFHAEATNDERAHYETVTFSAWAYRRQPELWIWLYESFVRAFLDQGIAMRIVRVFRCGIAKHGVMPLARSLAIMAFLAFPLTWIAIAIRGGLVIFGAAGLLAGVLVWRRWYGSVRTLIDRYGMIASHRERLGLQALIGDDLRALIDAWAKGGGPKGLAIAGFAAWTLLIAFVWALVIEYGGVLPADIKATICQVGWCREKDDILPYVAPVAWLVWALWVALVAAVLVALLAAWGRVDRILLVVDDLDRCPPNEIVDLIDGIKLMLEQQVVGQYVQALVLADNDVLVHAIRKRFADYLHVDETRKEAALRRLVREHMEKVFLCHYYLRPLTTTGVSELVRSYVKELQPGSQLGNAAYENTFLIRFVRNLGSFVRNSALSSAPPPSGAESPPATENSIAPSPVPMPPAAAEARQSNRDGERPLAAAPDENLTFTSDETETIIKVVESHFGTGVDLPTPRFLRSFFFKYQLARMILQMGRGQYSSAELADRLARAVTSNDPNGNAGGADDEIGLVVQQVA